MIELADTLVQAMKKLKQMDSVNNVLHSQQSSQKRKVQVRENVVIRVRSVRS